MENILIIGASSAVAEATARLYAEKGQQLYLIARNESKLNTISNDLKIRGAANVITSVLDVSDFDSHKESIENAFNTLGKVDTVLIAHGSLPAQEHCEHDFEEGLKTLNINAISTLSLLSHIANIMEEQKEGTIAVITSVAGDRGRQSNYFYGSAKGMVSIFLQGLRQRLYKANVHVVDIKPGFIDSPMTADFKKGVLWSKPENIAAGIVKSIDNKRNVVYLPAFWKAIMMIITNIPEFVFKKIRL